MGRHIIAATIITLMSFWAIRPLVSPGFFPMHDDTQVGRVIAMGRAIRNGQFPVRWVGDLGYGLGYPIFNFYGPLPYYVGGFVYALGIDGLTATKLMFILGILLSAFAMYFWAASVFGIAGGLVASIFYLYAPYHAVQIYVRGAVGEFWMLVFLPLLGWGFWQVSSPVRRKTAIAMGSLGLAGIILSHTIGGYITTLLVLGGLLSFSIIGIILKKLNFSLLTSCFLLLLIGLGLAAFFWLPAVGEMQFTNVAAQIGGTANFSDHFVCPAQLWNSWWGYGGSAPGCLDGLSFKLGKLHLVGALLSLVLVWVKKRALGKIVPAVIGGLAITVVSIFFMLSLSTPVWEIIPGFVYIQYPWRFLAYAIFGLSLVAGGVVLWTNQSFLKWLTAAAAAVLVVTFSAKLFVPQHLYPRAPGEFEDVAELRWRVSKISDEYLPSQIIKPTSLDKVVGGPIIQSPAVQVETEQDTEIYTKFFITTNQPEEIVIRRAHFPGWVYSVNGSEVPANIQNGLPHLALPPGRNVVELRFTNTPIRRLGNMVSLLTIAVLILVYGKKTHA